MRCIKDAVGANEDGDFAIICHCFGAALIAALRVSDAVPVAPETSAPVE